MNTTTKLRIGMGALMLALAPAATLAQNSPTFTWRSAGDNAFLSHQRSAVVSPDGTTLYTASQDNTLKIYDVATGRLKRTLVGSGNQMACIALSHDGRQVVAGGSVALGRYAIFQPLADVWNTADYSHIETLKASGDFSTAVAFSADDKTIALATESFSSSDSVFHAQMQTCRAADGAALKTFVPLISSIDEITYAKDGKTLVAVGQNDVTVPHGTAETPTAEIWDPVAAVRKTTVKTKMNYVFSARFSPDGKQLALGGATLKSCVELWDATGSTLQSTLLGAGHGTRSIAYTLDGVTLMGGGSASAPDQSVCGLLETWNVADGKRLCFSDIAATAADEQLAATDLSFSADGKSLAVSYGDPDITTDTVTGAVRIFDTANGQLKSTLATTAYLTGVRYSADGSKLITSGYNLTAETGTETGSLTIRRTSDNLIVADYNDDLGTGVNSFSLNEALDLIVVTQTDSTLSTLSFSGI